VAISIFVEPLIIEPMFNKFTPMAPSSLRDDIAGIAAKAGINDAPIFVVDKSKQTKTINAYVTGIGSSARIVLWDNTIKRLPQDQIRAVVAHEAGHYALGHIFWGFLVASGGIFVVLLAVERCQNLIIAKLPSRWQVTSMTDLTAIPVAFLAIFLGSFLVSPLDNAISRLMEHQADAFGLQLTGDGPAMARAFVSLSEQNLSNPDPPALVKLWLFSHPTLKERIEFCLNLHP
jgi:STE24 endopeptidase